MISNGRLEVRHLRGQYRIANSSAHASGIEAETLGGRIIASLDVDHLEGNPTSHLRANLRGISLSAAQRMLHNPELAPVALAGTIEGTTDATWAGAVTNAHARVDLV